jgi:hypothetical protein
MIITSLSSADDHPTVTLSLLDYPYSDFDLAVFSPTGIGASVGVGTTSEMVSLDPSSGGEGWWYIRIYEHSADNQKSNGRYAFEVKSHRYVLSIAGYGVLSFGGDVYNPDGMTGYAQPANSLNDCAGVASYIPTGAGYISGYLNELVSGDSYIYFHGDGAVGYTNTLRVYVSTDNQNWQLAQVQTIAGNGALSPRYVCHTTLSYRYILFCHYGSVGCVFIDNVIIQG